MIVCRIAGTPARCGGCSVGAGFPPRTRGLTTVVMEVIDVVSSKRPTDPEKPAYCESEGQVYLGLADVCGARNSHLAHG